MKFTDYPLADSMADEDVFLIDGARGTKKIPKERVITEIKDYPETKVLADDDNLVITGSNGTRLIPPDKVIPKPYGDIYELYDTLEIPWQLRRTIYRGKNLGSRLTDEQKKNISNGTFKGMFLGDYWKYSSLNTYQYRIVDFNHYRHSTTQGVKEPTKQVVIMADNITKSEDFDSYEQVGDDGGFTETAVGNYLLSEGNLQNILNIDDSFIESIVPAFYPMQTEMSLMNYGGTSGSGQVITSKIEDVKAKISLPGYDSIFGYYGIEFPNYTNKEINSFVNEYKAYKTGMFALYEYYHRIVYPSTSLGLNNFKSLMPYILPAYDNTSQITYASIDLMNDTSWLYLRNQSDFASFRPVFCLGDE